jgi:hypothetical protein
MGAATMQKRGINLCEKRAMFANRIIRRISMTFKFFFKIPINKIINNKKYLKGRRSRWWKFGD